MINLQNLTTPEITIRRDNILAGITHAADDTERAERLANAAAMTAELNRRFNEYYKPVEIAYRIPGKGNFKRRTFKTEAAAEAFTTKLREREGDDVEIRWAS